MKKNFSHIAHIIFMSLLSISATALSHAAAHAHKAKASQMASDSEANAINLKNITISNGWVRPTVTGQKATGAFMTLTAKENLRLQSANSAVAGVTEVHEMKMENGVMKMRALSNGLILPAGKAVELKPGGYHVMLMDLKQEIKPNEQVPVSLTFVDGKGQKLTHTINLKALMKQTMPTEQKMQHNH